MTRISVGIRLSVHNDHSLSILIQNKLWAILKACQKCDNNKKRIKYGQNERKNLYI